VLHQRVGVGLGPELVKRLGTAFERVAAAEADPSGHYVRGVNALPHLR